MLLGTFNDATSFGGSRRVGHIRSLYEQKYCLTFSAIEIPLPYSNLESIPIVSVGSFPSCDSPPSPNTATKDDLRGSRRVARTGSGLRALDVRCLLQGGELPHQQQTQTPYRMRNQSVSDEHSSITLLPCG